MGEGVEADGRMTRGRQRPFRGAGDRRQKGWGGAYLSSCDPAWHCEMDNDVTRLTARGEEDTDIIKWTAATLKGTRQRGQGVAIWRRCVAVVG